VGVLCLFLWDLNPHLTQCRLGRRLPPYQVASWSIQPFGHNRHGPKTGGSGSSCNTMSPRPTPTQVPIGTLIHAAVWPQHVGQNWGCASPFGGERGSHLTLPGARSTFVPSSILIHLAVWPQQTWTGFPFFGEGETDRQTTV